MRSSDKSDHFGTSGQNGQKSGGGKFRRESTQPRPSSRLRQEEKTERQLEESGKRVEKTGARLDKAREALVRKQNPGPVKKTARVASKPVKAAHRQVRYGVWGFAHQKIYEVERENVAVEAAHRAELAGEVALREGKRFVRQRIRTHPARRVRSLERESIRAKSVHERNRQAHEHPQIKSNPISRRLQKQRLQKQY